MATKTYQRLYKHWGSVKAIAEALSTPERPVDVRAVGNWPSRGVPEWAQRKHFELTGVQLARASK